MAQYGVTVSRDDSEPSVLGSARSEASVYLGASGDLRAETHTLSSSGTPAITNDRNSHRQRAREALGNGLLPPPRFAPSLYH